ncbi:hypothetical protein ACFQXA_36525 [Nocardiopsis composta]
MRRDPGDIESLAHLSELDGKPAVPDGDPLSRRHAFVLVTERFRITDSDWATVVTAYGSPAAARATLDAPSAPTSRTTSETTASATSSKCAWRYTPLPVPGRPSSTRPRTSTAPGRASPSAGPPSASPTGWRPRLPPGRLERMDGTTCFPGLIPRLPPSGVQDPAPLTPARRRSAPDAPAAVARHHHARYNQTST